MVFGEIRQAACRARENVIRILQISGCDASAQNHLCSARGTPHGRKFRTQQKVFSTA
jgi:hypothetical protein